MSVKHIGTTAAAAMFGLALLASSPAGAAPLGTVAAEIDAAIDSSVIQVARRGDVVRRGPVVVRRGPIVRRGPVVLRRGPVVLRRGPADFRRGGPRIGRVARLRPGFFRPGRRLWVYPALGAGLLALTLAPGWYWGDYYDECRRWIIPCPGCAPALVDLCEPY